MGATMKIVRCVSLALAVGALAGRPSLFLEDDKTTTAKPAAKDANDDAGKGKSTGEKKKAEKKEADKKESLLEDDNTTTAKPAAKDAKDDAGKGKSTGDNKEAEKKEADKKE